MRELLERVAELERKHLLVLVGMGLFLILVVVGIVMFVGGGGDGGETEVEAVLLEEGEVARRVEATLEAMAPDETPTPVPTPDVGATLQAKMDENREMSERVVAMNPLDSDEVRNPYLNAAELAYLVNLGSEVWKYTKVWMMLREMLSRDPGEWSHLEVEYTLSEVLVLVEDGEDFRVGNSSAVGPVVDAYIDEVYSGARELRKSVHVLQRAGSLLGKVESGLARDLSLEGREELTGMAREIEYGMEGFDNAMGRYGCGVCGELFRLKGR